MAALLRRASVEVMIVEPDVSLRTIAADKLRQAGLLVVEAANAEEASSYLQDGSPVDLVFGDVRVPDPRGPGGRQRDR